MCSDVGVEPALQPLDGEPLQFATANSEDGACLDAVARDFWGGTILRNGTERNDGLNYGTERFLKLKLATYHC